MAKCKNCHRKGFIVETDVNGLCVSCAPYYYLTLPDDLKALNNALQALNRIDKAEAVYGRLETLRASLDRLRSFAVAGLIQLPRSVDQLDRLIEQLARQTTPEP